MNTAGAVRQTADALAGIARQKADGKLGSFLARIFILFFWSFLGEYVDYDDIAADMRDCAQRVASSAAETTVCLFLFVWF